MNVNPRIKKLFFFFAWIARKSVSHDQCVRAERARAYAGDANSAKEMTFPAPRKTETS